MNPAGRYCFFLGGHDLEMLTIRELLLANGPAERVFDKGLAWGAVASSYRVEIEAAAADGNVPVLIELRIDFPLPVNAVVIDHHNEQAGVDRPTALEQVFSLLELPASQWTRRMSLVAANDLGHIQGLLEQNATADEIFEIRLADRRAQGITKSDEEQAATALCGTQVLASGKLTCVTLPHDRASVAADFLHTSLGGPGYLNLIVCTPQSVNVFCHGELIEVLRQTFPDCWYGGQLPRRGFWGAHADCATVVRLLEKSIADNSRAVG